MKRTLTSNTDVHSKMQISHKMYMPHYSIYTKAIKTKKNQGYPMQNHSTIGVYEGSQSAKKYLHSTPLIQAFSMNIF